MQTTMLKKTHIPNGQIMTTVCFIYRFLLFHIYTWNSNILRWFQFIWNIIARQTLLLCILWICTIHTCTVHTQCKWVKLTLYINLSVNWMLYRKQLNRCVLCVLFCVYTWNAQTSWQFVQIYKYKCINTQQAIPIGNVRTHSFNTKSHSVGSFDALAINK